MTAWIDLTQFSPSLSLVHRLPAGLLHYYQALPLAADGARVSVAMVYPGNRTAIAVLGDLLGAEIVPVETSPEAMQTMLAAIFPAAAGVAQVLLWADQAHAAPHIGQMAAALARVEQASLTELAATAVTPRDVLVAAAEGSYRLAVLALPEPTPLADLALRAAAPFLAVQPAAQPPQRILVVLRGFAADLTLVHWATALAGCTRAALTLLPIADEDVFSLGQLLNAATTEGRHLWRCTQVAEQTAHATLRLRTGAAQQQIVDELAAQPYDLLALPAEGHGEFAAAVLHDLPAACTPGALLLTKSAHRGATARLRHQPKRRL